MQAPQRGKSRCCVFRVSLKVDSTARVSQAITSQSQHIQTMVVDVRISNSELAAINAAAVTREYRVQPHLGASLLIALCGV